MENSDQNDSIIDSIGNFMTDHALAVVLIIATTIILRRVANMFIGRLVRKALRPEQFKTKRDEKAREDTLISTFTTGINVVIWVLAGLLLLSEFGIDIAPLIAGAGVAGVALGFGAQSMVKDFLAGVFVLVENQYRVGDVIQVNQGVSGTVEEVSLRKTVLRDLDGMVHHIPNGTIELATNMTMDYARINLDVGVGYGDDLEKVERVINQVGEDLANDPDWKEKIIDPPAFRRVEDFADSAVVVKIVGKTAPVAQWSATGELRKRLKIAFDKNGIEIPFPQRVIHQPTKKSK